MGVPLGLDNDDDDDDDDNNNNNNNNNDDCGGTRSGIKHKLVELPHPWCCK